MAAGRVGTAFDIIASRPVPTGSGSGFNFFLKEWSPKIRQAYPFLDQRLVQLGIVDRWNKATAEERKAYEVQEAKEKERQETEAEELPRRLDFEQEEGRDEAQPMAIEAGPLEGASPVVAASLEAS
eukprot:TRINITY_DN14317_c0_g1_i2.p1 TRINITY_DN14317_c0_g1~~TRINITY_DN14317_c0_g1_i2.p1  ORF type:complete len:137 (+),score=32.63 TRINITY_DN14317_c0_g1_i2:34-411(+)